MSRILGLDVGDKRIGVAVSDPMLIVANSVESYERRSQADDLSYFVKICDEKDVHLIVCGLPRNMNGTCGTQAEKVQEYAALVQEATGRPIEFWDERLTTVMVERTLLEADVSRKKRRKVVDKLAATAILQSYLDYAKNRR